MKLQQALFSLAILITPQPTAPAPGGVIIHGYSFQGSFLTVPLMDPPPGGTPTLIHWAYLLKPDGTVQRLPSKTVYAAR